MYKQIFYAPVPYRTINDPSLGEGLDIAVYINYPELILSYGEVIHSVNAFFVNAENTVTSTFTILLCVNIRTIHTPYTSIVMKFDGMTGAFLGYEDPFGAPPGYIYAEVVQSIDGSLWATTVGFLVPLDPVTRQAPDTSAWIPATFFEVPSDQTFHEMHHPMVDRSRDIIVMSASPESVDGRYILVNQLSTGKLLRRVWVSGPVAQIIQEDDRRCFVICTNGVLNVVDFTTGAVISTTGSPAVHTVDGQAVYAWVPSLRRLLAFNFVDANRAFLGGPPVNSDGSSPDSITGYYPVPIATNITRPIPLKPPRKGRTVPMLVRAVGDAGEAIPSLPITVTATSPGVIGPGAQITDAYGYATVNLIGNNAGSSEVIVRANVDGGSTGIVDSGSPGSTGGSTSGGVGGSTGGGTGGSTGGSAGGGTGGGTGGGSSGTPSGQPVAAGSQIAPLSVENISGSTVTNQPFTIGHAFMQGHLPASGAAITLQMPDNTAIAAQINVKATHPDGSVRHAIISGVIPGIAAGATVLLSMKRANYAVAGANVGLPTSLPSARLVINGVNWTATTANSGSYITWFSGPVASDFVFNVPFYDSNNAQHPTLTAQFSVRVFSTGHVRVDYVIEHCQAYASTTDITYDATLYAGGQPVYTRTGLVHTPTARWKRTFWQGGTPTLHVKHDIPYLLDSRQVPNYDRSITIADTYLNNLATDLVSGKFDPMQFGRFRAYMPDYGGRSDIGLMPDSHAALLLSMDKRAKALVLAAGDIGGSWPMCRRDDSNGTGRGYPLSVTNFPYASILGSVGDCNNPATGKNEHLPALTSATTGVPDSSHQPAIYYLPYLLTGDYFYLEGLQFCCAYNHYKDNPEYRNYASAWVKGDQVRGQGWSLRTLSECAAITPDDHYLKSHFTTWYSNNMAWYAGRYLDATDNQLGIITNGYSLVYDVNGGTGNGLAPWQDDFFTQSLGHQYELLGLDTTKRLLLWKAKFQIGRMNDPAVCVQNACIYALGVRNNAASPLFTTLADCFAFSVSSTQQLYACGSPQRLALASSPCLPGDIDGYPSSETGYPSNYQPALAAAVDAGYAGGAQAWSKFMARPTKPNYGLYGAQFAVVAR